MKQHRDCENCGNVFGRYREKLPGGQVVYLCGHCFLELIYKLREHKRKGKDNGGK